MFNTYIIGFLVGLATFFICFYFALFHEIKNSKFLQKYLLNISIVSILLTLFLAFFSPFFFTSLGLFKGDDFKDFGPLGDTLGGLMNPFIGIAAVIVTGLAFYAQYQANEEVRNQFKLQQFESQFYEMLRLHKENVNEMEIEGYEYDHRLYENESMDVYSKVAQMKKSTSSTDKSDELSDQDFTKKQIKGRKIFYLMDKELSAIYMVLKKHYYKYAPNEFICANRDLELKYTLLSIAYDIFFSGKNNLAKKIRSKEISKFIDNEEDNISFHEHVLKELEVLRTCHKKGVRYIKEFDNNANEKKSIHIDFSFKPFGGHQIRLAHYYRHIFALVKSVVGQPLLTYEEKRKYLKIFRAQLSNHEVVMLYYNWLGGYGIAWEIPKHIKDHGGNGNKFFTDYRVIHNLNGYLVLDDFHPERLFSAYEYDNFLYKSGEKLSDVLFEVHGMSSALKEIDNERLKADE